MALSSIPILPPVLTLTGSDQLWLVQAGVDSRATIEQITQFVVAALEQGTTIPEPFQPIIATGLTATGTTQGTALPVGALNNFFTTVASGTGAVLTPPNGVFALGLQVGIFNNGANAINLYPNLGAQIDSNAVNTPVLWLPGYYGQWLCEAVTGPGVGTAMVWRTL